MGSKLVWIIILFHCAHTKAQSNINVPLYTSTNENNVTSETNNRTYDDTISEIIPPQESMFQPSTNENSFQENINEVVNKTFVENMTTDIPIQSFASSTADPSFNEMLSTNQIHPKMYSNISDITVTAAPNIQSTMSTPQKIIADQMSDVKMKLNQNKTSVTSYTRFFTKPPMFDFYQSSSPMETVTDPTLTTQTVFATSSKINDPIDHVDDHSNIALKKERITVKLGQTVNLTCGTNDISESLLTENTDSRLLDQEKIMQKLANQSMARQWKLFWINSTEEAADLIRSRTETTADQVILYIPILQEELFKSTYTCQLQDPTNKVWNVKTVYLVKNESKTLSLQTTSKVTPLLNTVKEVNKNSTFSRKSFRLITSLPTTSDYIPSVQNFNNNSEAVSKMYTVARNIKLATSSPQNTSKTFESSEKVLKPTKDSFPEEDFTTNKPNDTIQMDMFTEESTNVSDKLIVEEMGEAEEQKLFKEESDNINNNANGVVVGVALAAVMAGVGTILVLYRRRKVGKKSNYITFGNPSYSRENLPANDYSLESPLTLSSNGYTVLA